MIKVLRKSALPLENKIQRVHLLEYKIKTENIYRNNFGNYMQEVSFTVLSGGFNCIVRVINNKITSY